MHLYFSPGACSLAPHIVLHETGAAFTTTRVDLAAHRTVDGDDYYAINPKGSVPLLRLEDGSTLSEGPVIAQYVAERAGRADLLPPSGDRARYRVLEWQNYITSEIHKSYSPLFNPAFDDGAKTLFRAALLKKYTWIDSVLAGSDYLTGNTFTVADPYLYVVSQWAPKVGVDLTALPHLQAYLQRIAKRPAVIAARKAEGLPA